MKIFDNKTILVTGGTGSFGRSFVRKIILKSKPKKIVIFSRDELKQWIMQNEYKNKKNIKFIIGDVRNLESVKEASKNVDYIIHAAATKIVPTAEINPEECIYTNINGAMNIIKSANQNKVKKVIALSTDKACNPVNLYGATKLASDKLFIAANKKKTDKTIFCATRYGNVMGSRGSVIPFFISLNKKNFFPITNPEMTRFMISLDEAVDFVNSSLNIMQGGEIFVKKIPSMKIIDIARAIDKTKKIKIVGMRDGEKIHEQMITPEDSKHTLEFKDFFIISSETKYRKKLGGKKVKSDFSYDSKNNKDWMNITQLKNFIKSKSYNFE